VIAARGDRRFHSQRPKRGFVYFICPEALLHRPRGDQGAMVKIGYTGGNPKARLRALQTGSPMYLRVWAYIDGTEELEAAFHNAFAPLRSHGEWFYCEGKLRDFMAYLGEEPNVGLHVGEEALEAAVHDNVFSLHPPHPSVDPEEWLASAYPAALAGFFPDAWVEALT
jgi:hypothetical protein